MSWDGLPRLPSEERTVEMVQVAIGAAGIGSVLLVAWLLAGTIGATGVGRLFATLGLLLILDGMGLDL